jgi:hypothetical protein
LTTAQETVVDQFGDFGVRSVFCAAQIPREVSNAVGDFTVIRAVEPIHKQGQRFNGQAAKVQERLAPDPMVVEHHEALVVATARLVWSPPARKSAHGSLP